MGIFTLISIFGIKTDPDPDANREQLKASKRLLRPIGSAIACGTGTDKVPIFYFKSPLLQ